MWQYIIKKRIISISFTDINECQCVNGNCTDDVNNCECHPGFTGVKCDTGMESVHFYQISQVLVSIS